MPESCFQGSAEKTLESIAELIKVPISSAAVEVSDLSFESSSEIKSSVNCGLNAVSESSVRTDCACDAVAVIKYLDESALHWASVRRFFNDAENSFV